MKMKSFRDYLWLSNSCSYDVDDVIGRVDRSEFQNFCSPGKVLNLLPLGVDLSNFKISEHDTYN